MENGAKYILAIMVVAVASQIYIGFDSFKEWISMVEPLIAAMIISPLVFLGIFIASLNLGDK